MMKLNETRIPVYVNIYDFTTANSCLKIIGLSGYHCGIEIKYPMHNIVTSNIATA